VRQPVRGRARPSGDGGDLYDWSAVTARLAAQAPRWEPEEVAGPLGAALGIVMAAYQGLS
jgi:hypothetical protein